MTDMEAEAGAHGASGEARRGARLRVLLLAGLALAVIVPFVLFAWLGDRELRRATKEGLGKHLMLSEARAAASRIVGNLARARDLAESVSATPVLRESFRGTGAAREAFALYHSRVSELLASLILVAHPEAGRAPELIFPEGLGERGAARIPERAVLETWLEHENDPSPKLGAPMHDPFARASRAAAPRDPESWVLPFFVPLRDDTQQAFGVCVMLLPLEQVQSEIEATRTSLIDGAALSSGDAYIVDRSSGTYVLHTQRDRIGQRASAPELDGFAERDGVARASAALSARALPQWSVGVQASASELFRSVDTLSGFFLGLVVLVLGATLGIGALISLGATRSLSRLEETTNRLGAGELSARAEVAGPREVRSLALEFNRMAERLERGQERLKQAERDRAWTKMARQVAHEIKNPLQPVRLHAEMIARAASSAPIEAEACGRVANSATVILRQVDALRRIVADFSEYAHAAMPIKERVRFEASDVLEDIASLYAVLSDEDAGQASQVTIVDRGQGVYLLGSALRLQQVLVNLVKNALEASAASSAPVEIEAWSERGVWVVEIRDRGHGLPDGGAQQAFEPSFSTKPGGTGLGLAICQRNVDAMGGQIELLPREGGGSVARVSIELAP